MSCYADRVRFRLGDATRLEFTDGTFDGRALAAGVDLVDRDVSRIADAPILMICGRRADR